MRVAESFNPPDGTERLQINLEDDVRSFLLSRLPGNQMDTVKKKDLRELGIDVRRLSKPSYIKVHSGSDAPPDENPERCHIGAEGVMSYEDDAVIHLAFKCGDPQHQMHYTTYLPETVIQMALAMEATWKGSIMVPMIQQAVKLGRDQPLSDILDEDEDEEEEEDVDLDEELFDDEDDDGLSF